jgi:hypothetical protein
MDERHCGSISVGQRTISEKFYKALDEFGYLPFSFIAFGHLRRQPMLDSRKQPVESFADCRIRIKLAGHHAESSVVSIRS